MLGVAARKNSAALILKKLEEIIEGDIPVILTGDFNVNQDSEAYHLLKNAPGLQDTYEAAKTVYANNGTTNSFDNTKSTNSIIDHIFVSNTIHVKKYGILTDTYHNRFPSDHFPVVADIHW